MARELIVKELINPEGWVNVLYREVLPNEPNYKKLAEELAQELAADEDIKLEQVLWGILALATIFIWFPALLALKVFRSLSRD